MTLPPRKYFSEITLGLFTKNALAITPSQLMSGLDIPPDAKAIIDLCHIYAICRRPALSFDPTSFKYELPISSGKLVRRLNGVTETHDFQFEMINQFGGNVQVSDYPYREIVGFDANGERQVFWPAAAIAMHGKIKDRTINDFEVLYIGQSFGDGTRTAFDRLQSHKTLQKVLADLHHNSPDQEIMLFMFEYDNPTIHIQMDGRGNDAQINGDEDLEHIRDITYNPLSDKELISIAEAGLIWYFRPEYNLKLKDSEPSPDLKLLQSCYNLDFAGLIVEINTEEFPCRLWSPSRGAGHHHIAQFDLHNRESRRTFFSIIDDQGALRIIDTSGPAY